MKNKKMVATLASLCLIVVAVVAAVVGVLAATTQNVTSQFTVKYTAENVAATLTLKSWGPTKTTQEQVTTRSITNGDDGEGDTETKSFLPGEKVSTKALASTATYDFGWSDNQGADSESVTFHEYAVYEIKIENDSKINAMDVAITINDASSNNIAIYAFSSESNLGSSGMPAGVSVSRTAAGVANGCSLTNGTAKATGSSVSNISATDGVVYLYFVVTPLDINGAVVDNSSAVNCSIGLALTVHTEA